MTSRRAKRPLRLDSIGRCGELVEVSMRRDGFMVVMRDNLGERQSPSLTARR